MVMVECPTASEGTVPAETGAAIQTNTSNAAKIACAILKLLYILFTNQSLIHCLILKQNSYWSLFSENFYKTPPESVETEGIRHPSLFLLRFHHTESWLVN